MPIKPRAGDSNFPSDGTICRSSGCLKRVLHDGSNARLVQLRGRWICKCGCQSGGSVRGLFQVEHLWRHPLAYEHHELQVSDLRQRTSMAAQQLRADGQYPSDVPDIRDVPLMMKLHLQVATLGCLVLAGCHAAAPVKRDILVGSYVYNSEDPESRPTDHEFDHLTLQADGKYDLVQGGPTKPKTETVGAWTVWDGGSDGPRVLLDHSGYPVEIKRNEVRLLIDLDTGVWWAKPR